MTDEHYRQFEFFRELVDGNMTYMENLDFDVISKWYIEYSLEYGEYNNYILASKVFDFLRIPNNMDFKQRLTYYQLLWSKYNVD